MSRWARIFVFFVAWWIVVFAIPDSIWASVVHRSIPWWATTARLVVWLIACGHLPGYNRFVGRRSGAKSSDVVAEKPTAPLVGWRAWRIGNGSLGLMSLITSTIWVTDKPTQATCYHTKWQSHGPAPHLECDCGLYIFSSSLSASLMRLSNDLIVYGPVLTWGRTQVHETGWRSQYAQPLALVRPRFLRRTLRQRMDLALERLGREYGIPVLSLKEAKALAERFRTSSGG